MFEITVFFGVGLDLSRFSGFQKQNNPEIKNPCKALLVVKQVDLAEADSELKRTPITTCNI